MYEERTLEIEVNGEIKEVEVGIDWSFHEDNDYGADADGNRGVFMEWWEMVDIEVIDPPKSRLSKEEIAAVDRAADKIDGPLEQNIPERC